MKFKKGNIPWNKKVPKFTICKECGEKFTDKPSKKRVYCSRECMSLGLSKRFTGREISEKEKDRLRSYNYNRVFTEEHRKNLSKASLGEKNNQWKGGIRKDKSGYVLLYMPDHPSCDKARYVRKHRLVMESKIGRFLRRYEIVHHLNGIKCDNNIENLQLLTKNKHAKIHYKDKLQK